MLWYCKGCTAAYAPGLERCPNCGSTKHSDVPPDQRPAESEPEEPAAADDAADEAEPATKRTRK